MINSYFKDGTFKAVKECKVVNYCKYVKGVPFVDRRLTKGLPFWKGLGVGSRSGASPYKIFFSSQMHVFALMSSWRQSRRSVDEIVRMLIIFR